MACATGKTLVALWATEQQHPATVLVPSLVLLKQLLSEWSQQTQWGDRFEYLCVWSDDTVTRNDAIRLRTTEVPFPVDTDPAVVRRFLDRPSTGSVRVVFSTYHSSTVVAEGIRGLSPFDVGIFDEAHKTMGDSNATFALALDDARLPIRKRLFFTATPRRRNIRKRNREGDFAVVAMDDPAVYGPRAHMLSFAEAVAQDLICDYRVVVSVVDPAEVTTFALQHGITLVEGDTHPTQWVAHQIAVSKAIAETGAQKVITFHSRVAHAKDFGSETSRGIGQFLDGFHVAHVNGTMSVADRADILGGFADDDCRLVTNARCLTEGVDLPAVDMVAFCSPRRSRIDIIQAVGRAMRKPRRGDKTLGYVVVPLLLAPHQATDLEDAARDTDWEDIVDVLAALRDADTRLEDLIRDAQIAKGRGEVFNPRIFAERMEVVGARVSLDVLVRHIGTVILEYLGVSWDERYGQLCAIKDAGGEVNVSTLDPDPARKALGVWLMTQRTAKRKGTLSAERIAQLDALGVSWNPQDDAFDANCAALQAIKDAGGEVNVSAYDPDPARKVLGKWLSHQRTGKKNGTLSAERITRLEALGVIWDPFAAAFDANCAALQAIKDAGGDVNVSKEDPDPARKALGQWLHTHRTAKRKGTLSAERISRLKALGVIWDPFAAAFDANCATLQEIKDAGGEVNVSKHDPDPARKALGQWLSHQRSAQKRNRLSAERITRLEALGVSWDPNEDAFAANCAALQQIKGAGGEVNVSAYDPDPARQRLGEWLQYQRTATKNKKLSAERISRLEALGVIWDLTLSQESRHPFGGGTLRVGVENDKAPSQEIHGRVQGGDGKGDPDQWSHGGFGGSGVYVVKSIRTSEPVS